MYEHLHKITRKTEKYEKIRNIKLETLDIITVLMKNDRVREFVWLDMRSPEEDRYSKKIMKDMKIIINKKSYLLNLLIWRGIL